VTLEQAIPCQISDLLPALPAAGGIQHSEFERPAREKQHEGGMFVSGYHGPKPGQMWVVNPRNKTGGLGDPTSGHVWYIAHLMRVCYVTDWPRPTAVQTGENQCQP
jgi:hypothetical protein